MTAERIVDVVVVGGGFGGALGAQRLEKLLDPDASILVVAPENFMQFTPLLPEAAAGTVEPRHTVIPLRELLRRSSVLLGRLTALDPVARLAEVTTVDGDVISVGYGAALIAAGSTPAAHPIPGLVEHAVGFKNLADAIWLRNRVLGQLELADGLDDGPARRRALTFTFVGGGFAGVEALAELESLAVDALRHYPNLHRRQLRWVLVEAQQRLLPGLDPDLARYTLHNLRGRGVEVHLGTRLVSCDAGVVSLSNGVEPFPSATIVWTAGQRPSALARQLDVPTNDRGEIPVDDHLRIVGLSHVYAVGDIAAVPDPAGGHSPQTAQHALRQARTAAANIAADSGWGRHRPYRYRTRGIAVTLGRGQGTAQVRSATFTGALAWWMGRSYHLLMMPGLARKARVVSDWTVSSLFPRDLAQIGSFPRPDPLLPPPVRTTTTQSA